MQLLIVEDDPEIAVQIGRGLEQFGHDATIADSCSEALDQARAQTFDAVILDRMLPDGSGIDVVHALRQLPGYAPVIMLSALGSVHDRITGLQAGADDYLAKPYDIAELGARIDAVTRRQPGRESETALSVGALALDPEGHKAYFRGQAIDLNRKQFSLLAHLLRNADRLVTRRMLLENVWSYSFEPATNIVESNMSRLRSRLQEVGCDAIETRRGEGYALLSSACV